MIKGLAVKFHKWKSGLGWAWKQLIQVVAPLAIAFGIAMGCYALYSLVMGAFPADQREAPFTDVLLTVLAIAGIGIAAFGAGAYKLLSVSIEAKVKTDTDKSRWLSIVVQAVDSGFLYWDLYKMSAGKPLPVRRHFLAQAIYQTSLAHGYVRAHLSLNDHSVLEQSIIIKNNWAYFIYEKDRELSKVGPDERAIALDCVEYLERYKTDFPEITLDIIDTIEKVAGHFRPATS